MPSRVRDKAGMFNTAAKSFTLKPCAEDSLATVRGNLRSSSAKHSRRVANTSTKPATSASNSVVSRVPPSRKSVTGKAKPTASLKPSKLPLPRKPHEEGNWLNRSIQSSVAGVGNYTGDFINRFGANVNTAGEEIGDYISNTTRYWGQYVAGYGNNIKDVSGVGGSRISTGGNPLGLAGKGSSQTSPAIVKTTQPEQKKAGGGATNPLGLRYV